jgi:hypothetical protein
MSVRGSVAVVVAVFGLVLSAGAGVSLAAGDANEASCPNEGLAGFESYLPDCRGYELLSPSYEDGQPLILHFISEEAGDGPHMIFYSLGDAAGAGGETAALLEPAVLEVGRGSGSGWGAVSLAPAPGDELADSADHLIDASANFSGTLWTARAPSQPALASDFYIRNSEGSFVSIGPIFSKEVADSFPVIPEGNLSNSVAVGNNFYYLGASSDLSHVLFVMDAEDSKGVRLLWPQDETAEKSQSLYEYSGVGNTTPTLVGVEGGKGSTALVSRCGTDLGSSSYVPFDLGSEYNAIADEGGRVFFTAVHSGECESNHPGIKQPVASEVWARVDGSSSVAISEPVLPPGAECTEHHKCFGAAHREGIFQGASRDGSKVFFLTEQSLVNGDEDEAMDLYEAELEGSGASTKVGKLVQVSHDPVASQAAEVQGVTKVSMDGSHVYFVAKGELAANANGQGQHAVAGEDNLYLFEQDARYPGGHVSFVATLSSEDEEDWYHEDARPVEVNECRAGEAAAACESGRYLVFSSRAHLTPTDTSETGSGEDLSQIFEYDAVTGEIARVSSGESSAAYPEGYNHDGNISEWAEAPQIATPSYNYVDSPVGTFSRLSVSSDGSRIVFTSQAALTPESGPECRKAYEYRSTGPISDGNVHLISDGHDLTGEGPEDCGPRNVWMDPSGADVLFQSGDPLIPNVGGGIIDFYDAREDGGSTVVSGAAGCGGEACRAENPPPSLSAAGSVSQAGEAGMAGSSATAPAVRPKAKPLTRAQKLSDALKACRKEPKKHSNQRQRKVCEARARRQYGGSSNSAKAGAKRSGGA